MDWSLVEEVFHRLLPLPDAERQAVLAEQPADVRETVERLLRQSDGEGRISRAIRGAAVLATQASGLVGSYRIVREIGTGGMGSVYLAVRADDVFEKQVAIKFVRRGMDSPAVRARFEEERRILARLEHPCIARLLDGGATPDGQPYIVMEYVEGTNIVAFARERRLGVRPLLELFLEVCAAVHYAHQNLVVHRDLKPGNIWIDTSGHPKLLDFGIARLLDPASQSAGTTLVRVMTPDYASPEQLRGQAISTATDVYSLGAVLYELLSGEKPFKLDGLTPAEGEKQITEGLLAKPSERTPGGGNVLAGDLDNIVLKAMRVEPEGRYGTAAELADDIRRYLDGYPVRAREGSFGYRVRKYLRRNRARLAVAAALAASLIAGTTVSLIQARRANAERLLAVASQAEARREAAEAKQMRGLAEAERNEANSQRLLAESRFEQVHLLAGKFLLDFNDAIASLPGSTAAQKMVVETGLKYFDTLVRDSHEPGRLREVARGYERLGDVQGNVFHANLGDYSGALHTYRKAQAIREEISDPSPAFLAEKLGGYLKLTEWMLGQRKLKDADELLETSLKMATGPSAGDHNMRVVLATIFLRLSDVKLDQGLPGEALDPAHRALEIWVGLAKEGRNPATDQGRISVAHSRLADIYQQLERAPEALVHVRAALVIDEPASRANPNDLTLSRRVFLDYKDLYRILSSDSASGLSTDPQQLDAITLAAQMGGSYVSRRPERPSGRIGCSSGSDLLGRFPGGPGRRGRSTGALSQGAGAPGKASAERPGHDQGI